jgi:hypothetical protein
VADSYGEVIFFGPSSALNEQVRIRYVTASPGVVPPPADGDADPDRAAVR